jgi:hypothetical protein
MTSSDNPGWSYVYRPVVDPASTPIYEQLVAEATYPQLAETEEPACPPDPLVGAP